MRGPRWFEERVALPAGRSDPRLGRAWAGTGGLAASGEPGLRGRPAARAGRPLRRRSCLGSDSGDLLAAAQRRPGGAEAGVEAAGAGWPRARLRAAPQAGRALVRRCGRPPSPAEPGGRGPGGGCAAPRLGRRPGLMSKSMPFLGASLCSSPSSSKANRLPRVICSPFAESARGRWQAQPHARPCGAGRSGESPQMGPPHPRRSALRDPRPPPMFPTPEQSCVLARSRSPGRRTGRSLSPGCPPGSHLGPRFDGIC